MNAMGYPERSMSVYEHEHRQSEVHNVSDYERIASLAVGSCMALYGLKKMSIPGALMSLAGAALVQRGWTGFCSLYDAIGMNTAAPRHADVGVRAQRGKKVTQSVTINRDATELYNYWRDIENLPKVFQHLKSVEKIDDRRSRWTAYGPGGQELQWEAEIITDQAGDVIAWQSLPNSDVDTAGSVHFQSQPAGGGTELRVSLKYDPPGGYVADRAAHLFGQGLSDMLDEDLRRFKQQIETGEIATNAIHGGGDMQSIEGMTSRHSSH